MAPTSHSAMFNSAQLATDQQEWPDTFSAQTAPSSSVGIYQSSPPHHNPCTVESWAKYITQFDPSPHYPNQFPPHVVGTEPYHAPLSHQNTNPDNHYVDAYFPTSHVSAGMGVPNMAPVGEVKYEDGPNDAQEWGSYKPAVLKGHDIYHSAHLGALQASQNSPASPLSTISSYSSPQSCMAPSPTEAPQLSHLANSGEAREERPANTPYSGLIFKALNGAKGKKLSLQGIYKWFQENTDKGRDENHKGWQNSIRHNLSMNAGFEAVKEDMGPGKKAVNFWRLTPEAIRTGAVQSTTRYRKGSPKGTGRISQRGPPEPLEGHASKKLKTATTTLPSQQIERYNHDHYQTELPRMNPYHHHQYPSGLPSNTMLGFGMGPITGCTPYTESHGIFIDSQEAGEQFPTTYDMAWYGPSGPNDRVMMGSNVPANPRLDSKEQ